MQWMLTIWFNLVFLLLKADRKLISGNEINLNKGIESAKQILQGKLADIVGAVLGLRDSLFSLCLKTMLTCYLHILLLLPISL
jgi:hypothetical protein